MVMLTTLVGKVEQEKVFRANYNVNEHKQQREVNNVVIFFNDNLQSAAIIAENVKRDFNNML